jgi:hypothetical protein
VRGFCGTTSDDLGSYSLVDMDWAPQSARDPRRAISQRMVLLSIVGAAD